MELSLTIGPRAHSTPGISELGKGQLVCQTKRELRMLQHMVEAEELNLILRGVDLGVTILEVAFDDKSRGIAGLGGAGMVATCVATLGTRQYTRSDGS